MLTKYQLVFLSNIYYFNRNFIMKQTLLISFFLFFLSSSFAQKNSISNKQSQTNAISLINCGNSSNPYSFYLGGKSCLWADSQSGLVAHVHRSDMNLFGDANTGFLRVSYSKDAGFSWIENEGPLYYNEGITGICGWFGVARYPQVSLYNPYQGTQDQNNPDSTYIMFATSSRNNSNPGIGGTDFGGLCYGGYKPGGLCKTQVQVSTDSVSNTRYYTEPSDFFVTQDGHSWLVDISGNQNKPRPYMDTIYLTHGVWNNVIKNFDLDFKRIPAPITVSQINRAQILDVHIAFAPFPNTNIGWISVLGHNDLSTHPDQLCYPLLFKTTDGGLNWSSAIEVHLNQISGLTTPGDSLYIQNSLSPNFRNSIGVKHDLAVDGQGIPHIIIAMGLSDMNDSASHWNAPKKQVMTTIWPDNITGQTWSGKYLSKTTITSSCFGDCDPLGNLSLTDYNRPEIGINWEGDKVFYSWLDNDTTLFPPINATYRFGLQQPDIWIAGRDLTANTWSQNDDTSTVNISLFAKNITKNSPAAHSAVYKNMSYYVLSGSMIGLFKIPFTYSQFNINTNGNGLINDTTKFIYIDGIEMDCNKFSALSVSENKATTLNCIEFPNPAQNELNVLADEAILEIRIFDQCGKLIHTDKVIDKQKAKGDISKFAQGVYNIQTLTAHNNFNNRFIKQ